jgi:hypothetical protein
MSLNMLTRNGISIFSSYTERFNDVNTAVGTPLTGSFSSQQAAIITKPKLVA